MKSMWKNKDYFTHQGKNFKVPNFFLYTKPKTEIPIFFAAQGKKAARYAGIYGDHLVTINSPKVCKDVIFPAFENAARENGKDPSNMDKMVEIQLLFSNKIIGIKEIKMSGEAGILAEGAFNESDPRKIQNLSRKVSEQKILENWCFVSSPNDIIDTIEKYRQAGATHIELVTHSFPDRIDFIGKKVLPYFKE